MAIAAGGLAGGNNANSATSVTRNMGSVTAGQLVVVTGTKYSPSLDAFVAGDCTQSAGTATLGTFTLDQTNGGDMGAGTSFGHSAVWSAVVTGSGTCTVQIAGAVAGSFLLIGAEAFTPDAGRSWGANRVGGRVNGALLATNATASSSTGNATSTEAAVFVAALHLDNTGATTITPDLAFTTIYENETGTDQNGSHIYQIVATGTTDAGDWTHGTTHNGAACSLVCYQQEVAGPTINTQPSSMQVTEHMSASFTVSATASGGSLTYQWKDNRTGSFVNCGDGAGATSATYVTAPMEVSQSGRQYQCVVTDSNGSVTTNNVTATVLPFNKDPKLVRRIRSRMNFGTNVREWW